MSAIFSCRSNDDTNPSNKKIKEAFTPRIKHIAGTRMDCLDSEIDGSSKVINIPIVVSNESVDEDTSMKTAINSSFQPTEHLLLKKPFNSRKNGSIQKETSIEIPVYVGSDLNSNDRSKGRNKRYLH